METAIEKITPAKQAENALAEKGITQTLIDELTKLSGLTVTAEKKDGTLIVNKEELAAVREARIKIKNTRTMIKNTCKGIRDEWNAWAKENISQENKFVNILLPIETALQEQEEKPEKLRAELEAEEKKKREDNLVFRKQSLYDLGFVINQSGFVLAQEVIPAINVEFQGEQGWQQTLSRAKIASENEAKRIADEAEAKRLADIETARLKKIADDAIEAQRIENERKQKELDDAAEKQRIENEKIKAENEKIARENSEKLLSLRVKELVLMGGKEDEKMVQIDDTHYTKINIGQMNDEMWGRTISALKVSIETKAEKAKVSAMILERKKELLDLGFAETSSGLAFANWDIISPSDLLGDEATWEKKFSQIKQGVERDLGLLKNKSEVAEPKNLAREETPEPPSPSPDLSPTILTSDTECLLYLAKLISEIPKIEMETESGKAFHSYAQKKLSEVVVYCKTKAQDL